MKDSLKIIFVGVASLLVISAISLYFGFFGNFFDATVGKQQMDIQRQNFEHNKSYVEGKIQDLAQYKREYQQAKDPAEKKQIENFVVDEFSSFNPSDIENPDLRSFLEDMEIGK